MIITIIREDSVEQIQVTQTPLNKGIAPSHLMTQKSENVFPIGGELSRSITYKDEKGNTIDMTYRLCLIGLVVDADGEEAIGRVANIEDMSLPFYASVSSGLDNNDYPANQKFADIWLRGMVHKIITSAKGIISEEHNEIHPSTSDPKNLEEATALLREILEADKWYELNG